MTDDADDENDLSLHTIGYYTVVYGGVAVIILIIVPGVTPLSDIADKSSDFSTSSSILSDESESTVSSDSGGEGKSTGSSDSGGESKSTGSSDSDDMPEFQLRILDRQPCEENSRLCRKVDVGFHNTGGTATDVEIKVSIITEGVFSDSTIYETRESIQKIKADEKIQRTKQINIGASDVPAIKANGCSIAAKVDIKSNEMTDTYWTDAQKVC